MGLLDDTAIFAAIVQHGGFSHAAKALGLSNGLISRRISQLEKDLGVTLIKRTTRQCVLTPEGELFWRHSQRIQQEIAAALTVIQASAKKPKGKIRISAPPYFSRQYLMPIVLKFLDEFQDLSVELLMSQVKLDPIKESLDLVIRGAGYFSEAKLKDSSLKMKLLLQEKIGLYASSNYLSQFGEPQIPEDLRNHSIIQFDQAPWEYKINKHTVRLNLTPKLMTNDIESCMSACVSGLGIGRFTELNIKNALKHQKLIPILTQYHWGKYHLYAVYSQQQSLPQRTRLLLEYIYAHTKNLLGGFS